MKRLALLKEHQAALRECRLCPAMIPPVIVGPPVLSEVMLVGQAPGGREGALGRPFAWTAGKRLFSWFQTIGVDEQRFRERAFIAAVCRCFPGKKKSGGDREPDDDEIARCRPWLDAELAIVRPKLVLAVGKMAIAATLGEAPPLALAVGRVFSRALAGADVIPLPHPSGASTWYHRDPGKELTAKALQAIARHPAWRGIVGKYA